jgi:hypothetical protein
MAGYTEPLKQHLREAGCQFERQEKATTKFGTAPSQALDLWLIRISNHDTRQTQF